MAHEAHPAAAGGHAGPITTHGMMQPVDSESFKAVTQNLLPHAMLGGISYDSLDLQTAESTEQNCSLDLLVVPNGCNFHSARESALTSGSDAC